MEKEEEKRQKEQKKIQKNIKRICKNNTRRVLLIKKYTMEIVGMIAGCMIMAIGTSFFLLPNQLSSGGFAGISTIIYYLFQFPLGTTMLILNIPLLILALFRIGKELLIKSLVGTVLLAVFIDIFDKFPALTSDKFLACIYGGIAMGIGTAIILKFGSSTGGTDLLSYIIRSFKPTYRASHLIVIVDTVIIALNVLFFKEIEIGLYSAITIYLMGKMIDIVFEGINFTKVLYIISPKYIEISQAIGDGIDRGSTGIYAKGMYTNEEKMMLLCVGSRGEAYKMKHVANQIDPYAFVIIMNAREVWGKGFKK